MTEEKKQRISGVELDRDFGRKRKNFWVIAGIIIGDLLIIACCLSFIFGIRTYPLWVRDDDGIHIYLSGVHPMMEMSDVGIVDDFFLAMSQENVERAAQMLSNQGKQNYPIDVLEKIVDSDDVIKFEIYRYAEIPELHTITDDHENYKEVTGTIQYDEYLGEFSAYLEKVYGRLLISEFEIDIPQEMIDYYLEQSAHE